MLQGEKEDRLVRLDEMEQGRVFSRLVAVAKCGVEGEGKGRVGRQRDWVA